MPRWPNTPSELANFAAVQSALHVFLERDDDRTFILIHLRDGARIEGELQAIHTRTSASYPIHHAATVTIRIEESFCEIDFLDIKEVKAA